MYSKNDLELKKYKWLNNNTGYGSGCHGKEFIELISYLPFNSIMDLGTGNGEFCHLISSSYKKVYGIDWAISPDDSFMGENIEYIQSDAKNIPLSDKSVDITTSWDFFEHIIPENVDLVLEEIGRVTKFMCLHRIACGENSHSKHSRGKLEELFGDGELHQSRYHADWWGEKLSKYGVVSRIRLKCPPRSSLMVILKQGSL